jgi:CxxC motif-containing protein (DUF1111 family)
MVVAQFRKSTAISLVFVLAACGSQATEPDRLGDLVLVKDDPSDLALSNLPREWSRRFTEGDALFELPFRDVQGLGPLYIRHSCSACHAGDGRGPGAVRKMVLLDEDGLTPASDQSGLAFGHTVRPLMAAGATLAITVPEDRSDLLVTKREPPAVFGRGFIEAVADSEIERIESEQSEAAGPVSGRINWVLYASEPNPDTQFHEHRRGDLLIGRFGLKARIATLDEFAADALQGDMGITSELRPNELPSPFSGDDMRPGVDLDVDRVNRVADYTRLVRLPKRGPEANDERGQELFAAAQCNACHVPTLRTRDDYPIEALAGIDAPIFSDLLLHDMGAAFSDGLPESGASGSEWRTAPLIGMRHIPRYLHDGRAETLEQAIELHGEPDSEAAESVARFQALDADDRAALLNFVSAL